MHRGLSLLIALASVASPACNIPRPTPYTGGPGFPSSSQPAGGQMAASDASAAAAAGASATPDNPLLGLWKSSDQQLDIKGDGTIVINGEPFTYAVGGHTLFVQGPEGTAASYPFELSGDELKVTVNGRLVVYKRQSQGIMANLAPPPGGAPAATPSELVGKWCYVANVTANDGGRQSSTCFTLNPDGSYQYHSETSSSGQVSGQGWGTSSQNDDQGRWQASGNTLTAQSQSGKVSTFTFEKRNHPKTNDPMLVFGNQAFVTYYQKPPW